MARKKPASPKRAVSKRAAAASTPAEPQPQTEALRGQPYPVVGIGASAGGFEAYRELLQALPPDTGMAFVLVQHLDPGHESMLTRLLSKSTPMPVTEVKEGMAVQPNHVYVIPPNRMMGIFNGVLHLTVREDPGAKHMPVDFFLKSLAEDQGSRAVGVILSGTASDGTRGLKAIKAEGGITFAQDEKSAKYDGMPRSAIAAGCVDFVLPPAEIAAELGRIGQHPYLGLATPLKAEELPPGDEDLQRIFVLLRTATGVDFTHYKYSTIRRRIARRMVLHKTDSLEKYLQRLRDDRSELEALYEDILIHVTGFFREQESYQALREEILPRLMSSKPPGEAIRVWVPGCSTGEEVYSLAIVLLEHLGDRANSTPIQIFGTDISDAAIDRARAGTYTESSLVDVSPDRLRRFFVKTDGGSQVTKSVREMCIFARQDLGKDPPFSRLDLISCRNVLIYMGPLLQKKVMGIFHYALKPNGFLILGKSESISGFAALFTPVDRKSKIHARKAVETHPVFDLSTAEYEHILGEPPKRKEIPIRFDLQKEADRLLMARYAPPGLIVNDAGQILHFRGDCSPYLSPAAGEASLGLLRMVRPEFAVELRTSVHKAKQSGRAVRQGAIPYRRNGQTHLVNLEVTPISGDGGERCLLVVFEEEPRAAEPGVKAAAAKQKPAPPKESESAKLQRELQTTKDYLQSIIEEQEATNEELKSANEEVLSSNEELQSTNEELETAKEELQSANEELVTVNEQLQNRNAELAGLSDDLANLLAGVNIPIVMLDNGRRIRRFTPQAEKLLNLLPTDLGRPIDNIRPNVDVPDLEKMIGEVIDTMAVKELEVKDGSGRWHSLRIRPYKTVDNKIEGVVMVFIDIDPLKRSQEALRQERDFVSVVLDTVPALVMVLDGDGRVVGFNRACQEVSGYPLDEAQGRRPCDFLPGPDDSSMVRSLYHELLHGRTAGSHEYQWVTKSGDRKLIAWSAAALRDSDGVVRHLICSGTDITAHRQADAALRQSEGALRRSQERLRALAYGLLDLQEKERARVARDIHDDLSQRMVAWTLEASELSRVIGPGQKEVLAKIEGLASHARDFCTDLDRIARDLHPATIEKLGLVAALKTLAFESASREGLKVRFTPGQISQEIPRDVALSLFRVAQEALRNVARHSGAKRALLSLTVDGDELMLSVTDAGKGFDPEKLEREKGLGLTSMEERVRLLNGTWTLNAKPGAGVEIRARVPWKRPPGGALV